MHYTIYIAVYGSAGLSVVEIIYTGNIWLVDNTYVWSIIGIEHRWYSSVVTDLLLGIFPWKLAANRS